MTAADRQSEIIAAFTGLADSLVDDYDVVDLTTQLTQECARLLDVAAAGLLLADGAGVMHLLAATSEEARKLEAFQLQREEGPCLDCYHTGAQVSVADLRGEKARWPKFTASAEQEGIVSVHAIPMRLRQARLGALGLFGTEPGALGDEDLQLAQGLAHVASIAIVQGHRTLDQSAVLGALQSAVASRGVVEMAKGLLTEVHSIDMQEAFNRMRGYARENQKRLTDVAHEILARSLPAERLLPR